jgi:beta-phosphoglucomutase-like phosphatase (HAD superfamily)
MDKTTNQIKHKKVIITQEDDMKKTLIYFPTILLVIFSIILINVASVEAINVFPKGPHFKLMEKLSKEQQEEVKNKVKELWESGASREKIRDAVKEMFEKYDVDFPDDMKGFQGMRGARHGRGFMSFSDQLSEDQKTTIKEKVESLRDQGASREEIHTEVMALLKEYGVDIPEDFKGFRVKRGHKPGRGFMRFSDELTEEQRATIHEKAKTMHEHGDSREEIHTEIGKMLKEYGIEVPDDFGEHREMCNKLNREQRKTIRTKMREMWEEGTTRAEIREEIHKMVREFKTDESDFNTDQKVETSGENLSIRSYPNPFNPETNIEYNLKSNAQVTIYIYDIQGKRVRSLGDDYRQAGTCTVKWDGLNERGTQVPSGVYFIRVSAGNETLNHRIVMMK